MSLKSELHRIEHRYQIELWQTYKLTEETYDQLIDKLQMPAVVSEITELDEELRKQISAEINEYKSNKSIKKDSLSPITSKLVTATNKDFTTKKRLYNLTEMALIYVVTLMEAFTKEYLVHLFSQKPALLKSSKSITYEEVLSFDKFSDLNNFLAEKEVEQVSYKNIDQLAEYVNSKLKLEINASISWWNICREANYRRNLIVHNRGIVNKTYMSKIKTASPLGTKLKVSPNYLQDATNAIKDYVQFFHNSITEKLAIE